MKTIVLTLIAGFFIGINLGAWLKQKQYVKRALEIPEKDTFTNQDIEHILYNTQLNP
jgi:lipopolysaccharide export system protein LptC